MWKGRGARCGEQEHVNGFEELFPKRTVSQALEIPPLPIGETAQSAQGHGVRSFFEVGAHVLLALGRHDAEIKSAEQEEIHIERFGELKAIGPAVFKGRSGLLAGMDSGFENGFGFGRDGREWIFEQIADAIVAEALVARPWERPMERFGIGSFRAGEDAQPCLQILGGARHGPDDREQRGKTRVDMQSAWQMTESVHDVESGLVTVDSAEGGRSSNAPTDIGADAEGGHSGG